MIKEPIKKSKIRVKKRGKKLGTLEQKKTHSKASMPDEGERGKVSSHKKVRQGQISHGGVSISWPERKSKSKKESSAHDGIVIPTNCNSCNFWRTGRNKKMRKVAFL